MCILVLTVFVLVTGCKRQLCFIIARRIIKDILNVCVCVFCFYGWSVAQITKALLGIQDSFEAQIEKLRNLDYTVLDVTTSRWHDDYNSFKDVVKDLEASSTEIKRQVQCTTASTSPLLRPKKR